MLNIKHFLLYLLIIILSVPIVFAQLNYDVYAGLLEAILGEIPYPCVDITDPLCWKCLLIGKILPLAFFAGFGYIFSLVILGRILKPGKIEEPEKTLPIFKPTAILLTFVIAISILHLVEGRILISIFVKVYKLWGLLIWATLLIGASYIIFAGITGIMRIILAICLIGFALWLLLPGVPPMAEEIVATCFP
jgi:hypothetical protein